MKIINRGKFILGVIDIIVGVTLLVVCIILHRTDRIVFAVFPILCSFPNLTESIETKTQRRKKEEEIRNFINYLKEKK